jgi:hypothetical protein
MPKLFALCQMTGGEPDVRMIDDAGKRLYNGHLLCGQIAGWGVYLFSGTGPQLAALNALPGVVGLVAVLESGNVKWAELDGTIAPAIRTKLNTWLSARGYPPIPAGRTYRQVVLDIYKRLNARWDLDTFDLMESP